MRAQLAPYKYACPLACACHAIAPLDRHYIAVESCGQKSPSQMSLEACGSTVVQASVLQAVYCHNKTTNESSSVWVQALV